MQKHRIQKSHSKRKNKLDSVVLGIMQVPTDRACLPTIIIELMASTP